MLVSCRQILHMFITACLQRMLHVLDNHRVQATNAIRRAQQDFAHFSSDGDRDMFVFGNRFDLSAIQITVVNNILNGQHFSLLW